MVQPNSRPARRMFTQPLTAEAISATREALTSLLATKTLTEAVNSAPDREGKLAFTAVHKAACILAKTGVPFNEVTQIILWTEGDSDEKIVASIETRRMVGEGKGRRPLIWSGVPVVIPANPAVKPMAKADAPKVVITRESVLAPRPANPTRMRVMLVGGTDEDRATLEALLKEIHKGDMLPVGTPVDPTVAELARESKVEVKLVPVS